MNTDTDLHWHADDDLLAAYVAGRTHPPVTASVEMHLLQLRALPRRAGPPRRPGSAARGLGPGRGRAAGAAPHQDRAGRCPARSLRPRRPAGRGRTGAARVLAARAAALPALLRHRGDPGGGRAPALAFLCIAPLLPVGAVAFAYGQEADPIWEVTLAAPYPPLRLLLLRAVSVVVVALPLAFVAAPVLPGPPWVAGAWLLPAFACAAFTLALSTWISVQHAAGATALGWVAAVARRRRTRTGSRGGGARGTGTARLPRHRPRRFRHLLDAQRPALIPREDPVNTTISLDRRDPSLRLHHRAGRARPRPVPRHHRPARTERRRQDHAAADPGHRAGTELRAAAGSSASTPTCPSSAPTSAAGSATCRRRAATRAGSRRSASSTTWLR